MTAERSVELAVLDMAGTTVNENGTVERNVIAALTDVGLTHEHSQLHSLRGVSKRDMFEALAAGSAIAGRAYDRFLEGMLDDITRGRLEAKPDATATFETLRTNGTKVCLITGFPPELRDPILEALGWSDAVDLVLSPEDAGRGRPYPDLIWAAMSRLAATGVQSVVVAGDTQSDLVAGYRSGASMVVGVLGGAHSEADLRQAPHTHMISGIGLLPEILRISATPGLGVSAR